MTAGLVSGLVWMVAVLVLLAFAWRLRRRRSSLGPGAMGAVHEMLHEDKRKAIEIIVEGRAEARDPEDADGNLPDLAGKRRSR
jgi:hypothetical protein